MNELFPFLASFWQKVIDDLVQSLRDVNRYASGNTAQQIGAFNAVPVKFVSSNAFEVTIAMPTYSKFIDQGVSGAKRNQNISPFKYTTKRPPISAIRLFMLNRGIVATDFRRVSATTGRGRGSAIETSLNRLAYAIAHKIFEDGLRPTNFYSDVVNDTLLLNFEKQIIEEYGKLIIDIIDIN